MGIVKWAVFDTTLGCGHIRSVYAGEERGGTMAKFQNKRGQSPKAERQVGRQSIVKVT